MAVLKSVPRVVGLVALVWIGALLLMQRMILFPRPPVPGLAPPLPTGGVVLELGPDRVEAWLLPPTDADGSASVDAPAAHQAPVILFTHGNGELVDHWLPFFKEPRSWGFAVLLVEYPGYGRSGGSPSESSIRATMRRAYDALATLDGVDPGRVIAYGRSLGGGAACALSRERPLSALVLESTFTSVRSLAWGMGVPGFLVLDPFDNLAAVEAYAGPVLVLHGERDEIVPMDEGLELARAAGVDLQRLPCGHNDCMRPWPQLRRFLDANGLLP
jgi:pimeloyl-ACP methyl ester carboxylesterase